MNSQEPLVLEGTWEEIAAQANLLVGHRLRVTILPAVDKETSDGVHSFLAQRLLKHAGTWAGDDFEACLQAVYDARGQAEF